MGADIEPKIWWPGWWFANDMKKYIFHENVCISFSAYCVMKSLSTVLLCNWSIETVEVNRLRIIGMRNSGSTSRVWEAKLFNRFGCDSWLSILLLRPLGPRAWVQKMNKIWRYCSLTFECIVGFLVPFWAIFIVFTSYISREIAFQLHRNSQFHLLRIYPWFKRSKQLDYQAIRSMCNFHRVCMQIRIKFALVISLEVMENVLVVAWPSTNQCIGEKNAVQKYLWTNQNVLCEVVRVRPNIQITSL